MADGAWHVSGHCTPSIPIVKTQCLPAVIVGQAQKSQVRPPSVGSSSSAGVAWNVCGFLLRSLLYQTCWFSTLSVTLATSWLLSWAIPVSNH